MEIIIEIELQTNSITEYKCITELTLGTVCVCAHMQCKPANEYIWIVCASITHQKGVSLWTQ